MIQDDRIMSSTAFQTHMQVDASGKARVASLWQAANTSGAENTSSRKLTPNRRIAKSLARPTKTKKARTDARNNIEKLNSDHMK